jgi:hypothetical protein
LSRVESGIRVPCAELRIAGQFLFEGEELRVSWSRRFEEPIDLPDGRKLKTLAEAMAWLAKEIPKSEHKMEKVQAAAHFVTRAADDVPLASAFARSQLPNLRQCFDPGWVVGVAVVPFEGFVHLPPTTA